MVNVAGNRAYGDTKRTLVRHLCRFAGETQGITFNQYATFAFAPGDATTPSNPSTSGGMTSRVFVERGDVGSLDGPVEESPFEVALNRGVGRQVVDIARLGRVVLQVV